jgi:hypothetical protein
VPNFLGQQETKWVKHSTKYVSRKNDAVLQLVDLINSPFDKETNIKKMLTSIPNHSMQAPTKNFSWNLCAEGQNIQDVPNSLPLNSFPCSPHTPTQQTTLIDSARRFRSVTHHRCCWLAPFPALPCRLAIFFVPPRASSCRLLSKSKPSVKAERTCATTAWDQEQRELNTGPGGAFCAAAESMSQPRRMYSLRKCCSRGGTSFGEVAKWSPPPPGAKKIFLGQKCLYARQGPQMAELLQL